MKTPRFIFLKIFLLCTRCVLIRVIVCWDLVPEEALHKRMVLNFSGKESG